MTLRQGVALLAVVVLLLTGRLVRSRLLVGPGGQWRDSLWLDALVTPAETTQTAEPARVVLTSPLPINTCSADSLTLLPGVGPVMAGRIAAARDSGLVFRRADDLELIRGIGPRTAARLDSLILFAAPAHADSLTP